MIETHENINTAYSDKAYKTAITTICLVLILIVGKGIVWIESGSAAILASLVDSIVDAGISTMNLMAIRYAMKPADECHRYGHGKAEGLAALFQSAFITGTAVFLVMESLSRLFEPQEISSFHLAIGVMSVSMLFSIIIVTAQRKAILQIPSLTIEADSIHYASDIMVNGSTIVILVLMMTGLAPLWLDPVFALCIAAYLLYGARDIGRKSINMLMDGELPQEVRDNILEIIKSHPEISGVHDMRTRRMGIKWHISFDVEMPATKKLGEVHEATRKVEESIVNIYPQAEVMIHMDPVGERHDSRHPIEEECDNLLEKDTTISRNCE